MIDKSVDYLYIPIKDLNSLKKIIYISSELDKFGKKYGIKGFVLFTEETFEENSNIHSRFFTPFYGVYEDSVTGSAQGPLGVYLIKNNIINYNEGGTIIKSEQGDIMNRPGRLEIKVIKKDNKIFSELIGVAVTILD